MYGEGSKCWWQWEFIYFFKYKWQRQSEGAIIVVEEGEASTVMYIQGFWLDSCTTIWKVFVYWSFH